MDRHDVAIIGGGPAGLAAAIRLRERGVKNIVVLEREAEAGGVPRHCGHWGFGWESHRWLWTGPDFAGKLRRAASQIEVRTATTVLDIKPDETLRVHSARGIFELRARRILVCTGTRESTRAARLLGGVRHESIMNTGTLQQLVYLKGMKPFARPAIIGSEWLSFSALMTCRHAGIKPVAMIEEEMALQAPRVFALGARLVFGVPVLHGARIVAVTGGSAIEGVEIEHRGRRRVIACDGVIVSGGLRPENALLPPGLIERDGHGPRINPSFQTSLPYVYAAGNVAGVLKTAGRCVVEARAAADAIARSLA